MTRCTKRTTQVDYNGETLTLKAKYSKHYEQPHTYFLSLTATLDGVDVADSLSLIVKKDACRGGDFHEVMDMHSDETQRFASTVFDGSGRLRNEFVREGSARRGTGVWGHELDTGSIVFIELVSVQDSHRGQGYGKWIIEQTLSQPEVQTCNFAYTWPCAIGVKSKEEHTAITARAEHIFSEAGFRRIGRTEFVAYAVKNAGHPSRTLAAENDASLLKETDDSINHLLTTEEMNNLTPEQQQSRKVDILAARYPLHHAIVNETDENLMAIFSRLLTEDRGAIRSQDFLGATPLHIAAMKSKCEWVGCTRL